MGRFQKYQNKLGIIMVLYLLGIFMGAIDTGIVTPARTIIQSQLGILDDKVGIWMITIFTLAYAASIPISGKLADRFGRKYIYVISIFLFAFGSFLCGFSRFSESFPLLLFGRVIQAIGGGGIMPIASAEFGTSFPKEKQGFALGLIGGVYGIANILGATLGSTILNIAGIENWEWLFFVNLPISIVIIVGGLIFLPLHRSELQSKKIDFLGIGLIVVMITSLLYGMKGIDFFDFVKTLQSPAVYPFLLAFLLILPIFIFVERKAEDPVLNLSYFTRKQILIILILSFMVGVCMMGMVFVPQYAENALKIAMGSGGYFVTILGFFAGFGAPFSGKLIDRFGAKRIMGLGFAICIFGSFFLALVATNYPNPFTVVTSLVIIGLGLGFVIGTALNYMMLNNTDPKESNSSLATLSLVRSIGTTIAPAIMIGFIAQAGMMVKDDLLTVLPPVTSPRLALYDEIKKDFKVLKQNKQMAKQLKNVSLPALKSTSMTFSTAGGGTALPQDLIDSLKSADVTNIAERTKSLASRMFDEKVPPIIKEIQAGVQTGIDKFAAGAKKLSAQMKKLNRSKQTLSYKLTSLEKKISGMQTAIAGIGKGITGVQTAIAGQQKGLLELQALLKKIKTMPFPVPGMPTVAQVTAQIKGLESAIAGMESDRNTMVAKKASMVLAERGMGKGRVGIQKAITGISAALGKMSDARIRIDSLLEKMKRLKNTIPSEFAQSEALYLEKIDGKRLVLENTFQSTMNGGFRNMYLFIGIMSILAFLTLLFYKETKNVHKLQKGL
ncbi:MAG: MFS transporter [Clostridia bacterium]